MIKIAFVGNPNVGKTALINQISNAKLKIGNWPGVTIEKKEVYFKVEDEDIILIDLPGIYNLTLNTQEEKIAYDFLTNENIDLIINVVDSTSLEKSMYLTTVLKKLNKPMIMALNYSDDFEKLDYKLDLETFQKELEIDAVFTNGKKGIGVDKLIKKSIETAKNYKNEKIEYKKINYEENRKILKNILQRGKNNKFYLTDKIDKILLNKFFGGILFAIITYAMFVIIFDGSAPFVDWVDGFFGDFITKYVGRVIEGVPDWLYSFVIDGIITGVGSVLTFVPLMFFIYFFMAILEESGYMARVTFILNKVMTKVGLSGKAFIPMLIGFGCTVPAIYSTRTLEDEKTRRLTALISTFMSCGARLPVYSLLAVAFFSKNAALVVVSIYIIGVFMALLMAFILKRFNYFKGNNEELIIELPPYRVPTFKSVWSSMLQKTGMYIKKATTVILGILLIIWFFSYFPNNGDTENSYLGRGAKIVQPLFEPTGFGNKWEPVASILPSIIAKETVVGFLGQVLITNEEEKEEIEYNFVEDLKEQLVGLKDATIDSLKSLINVGKFQIDTLTMSDEETLDEDAGGSIIPAIRNLWDDNLGKVRAYSFMLYVLLVVPCAVAMGALKQEFGWKLMIFQVGLLLILPYIVSIVFFNIARLFV